MFTKPTYEELEQRYKALVNMCVGHKQSDEALLELEKRYRNLFDSISDLVMIHDMEGRLLSVNPAVAKLSGYALDELIGHRVSDFIALEFRPLFQEEYLKEIMRKGKSEGVVVFQAKNGAEHYVEYRNVLVHTERGDKYVSGLGRDITDRVLAERALRENEERYRTVFETTGTATIIVEDDGTISLANSTFAELSGYSKEEIEGKKSLMEFVSKKDLAQMRDSQRIGRDDNGPALKNFEFRFSDRRGDVKRIFISIKMIPGSRKTVASLLDITARKRAEEALQASYNDLENRVRERTADLAKANDQLKGEIVERRKAEKEKEKLIVDLKKALGEVKKLSGLLPICASCKKIRDDKGYWNQLEDYIRKHSEAEFSHSVCPECARRLYPELEL